MGVMVTSSMATLRRNRPSEDTSVLLALRGVCSAAPDPRPEQCDRRAAFEHGPIHLDRDRHQLAVRGNVYNSLPSDRQRA